MAQSIEQLTDVCAQAGLHLRLERIGDRYQAAVRPHLSLVDYESKAAVVYIEGNVAPSPQEAVVGAVSAFERRQSAASELTQAKLLQKQLESRATLLLRLQGHDSVKAAKMAAEKAEQEEYDRRLTSDRRGQR